MADQPQQQQEQEQPEPEMAVQQQQWEGAVEARLPSTRAAAAWPHIAAFCSLHRYLPGIDVCERVAGEDGVVGCVRYVASRPPPPPPPPQQPDDQQAKDGDGDDDQQPADAAAAGVEMWAREQLLERDDARRRLVYAVVGSNMGFGRYVGTMSLVDDGEDVDVNAPAAAVAAAAAASAGCRLVWGFECEPMKGWTRDGLLAYLDAAVMGMAERIEAAAAATAATATDADIALQDAAAACN
uniref:Bet v I/Major latex protein domain-containing protein n=1 Tax=Oryza punctata TaxID=4537 RepID=A0A0E0L0U8_ORYPU